MAVVVESFTLDHTKVTAPFVRRCTVQRGAAGDTVAKFDLRFAQPNVEEIDSPALHTLEHLLAGFMREEIDGIIDLSPMGCRTGFYLTVWNDRDIADIVRALTVSLQKVASVTEIPAENPIQCGNYRLHNLAEAKRWAAKVISAGIADTPFKK